MPTWLLTREAADAERDVAALRARGVQAEALPCLETRARPWPTWAGPADDAVTLFTSRRAVAAWVAAGKPAMGRLAAVEPHTARAVRDAGARCAITAEGGAVGLAEAVVQWWQASRRPRWRVRYPTSDAGLDAPEQAAALERLSAIGPVQRHAVYEAFAPEGLRARVLEATAAPYALTFASPSAVRHFLAVAPPVAPQRVLCHGASTARAWDAARPATWPAAEHTEQLVERLITLEEPTP